MAGGAAHPLDPRFHTVVADAQVEVYEDLYEAANQRMGEYSNVRKEFLLEWLIVVLLSAELIAMVGDMLWNHIAW